MPPDEELLERHGDWIKAETLAERESSPAASSRIEKA